MDYFFRATKESFCTVDIRCFCLGKKPDYSERTLQIFWEYNHELVSGYVGMGVDIGRNNR